MLQRPRPEGIRITRTGAVYILLTLIVGLAAANTGNNALYMVAALMLGVLAVSGFLSRANLRGMDVELLPPPEVFAGSPFALRVAARLRRRRLSRWSIVVTAARDATPCFLPVLARGQIARGLLPMPAQQRGRRRIEALHLASLFPFGLLRKGVRFPVDTELLVYPRILDGAPEPRQRPTPRGGDASRHPGRGDELLGLRQLRHGDDPRHIHWKQTARTGELIVVEREAEEGRHLTVVLDNGVGALDDAKRRRFEHLISQAATAAVRALAGGAAVELITRSQHLPPARGARQRRRMLEALALLQPVAAGGEPLAPAHVGEPQLRLGLAAGPEETA